VISPLVVTAWHPPATCNKLMAPLQDPEAILSRVDVRSTIQKLRDRLPPRSKAILSLYYLQELSYEEIGAVMTLPLGTVKTHLRRAKQALRDMIVEEGLWNEMSAGHRARQATPCAAPPVTP
jgi:DNA-directed RNA polymerase specialized sigma24 family protein